MSLIGLAEQTCVSCLRMWIPMAKTAAARILGQINRKRTKVVESHTISPPVPIAIASWGGGSGPCILLLQWHPISSCTVLRSENSTFHLQLLGLPEESVSNGHSPHRTSDATGKGQSIYRPTADISSTSQKFHSLLMGELNCRGESSLDWCTQLLCSLQMAVICSEDFSSRISPQVQHMKGC